MAKQVYRKLKLAPTYTGDISCIISWSDSNCDYS